MLRHPGNDLMACCIGKGRKIMARARHAVCVPFQESAVANKAGFFCPERLHGLHKTHDDGARFRVIQARCGYLRTLFLRVSTHSDMRRRRIYSQ